MACGDRFSIIITDETRGLEPQQKMSKIKVKFRFENYPNSHSD